MQRTGEAVGELTAADEPAVSRANRLLALAEHVPWRVVGSLVGLALFGAALFVLQKVLGDVSYDDIGRALEDVTWTQLFLSLLCTAFSYAALTGYDFFALRHIGRTEVPYRTAALASFTGYALSYTIGFQVLVAAAVRYRAYAAAGLTAAEVAALTLVSGLTFWLGIAFTLGLGLTLEAEQMTFLDQLAPSINRALGIAVLLAIAGYLLWLRPKRRTVTAAGFRLPLPGFRSTFAQLGIGLADILGAAAALYVLLPGGGGIEFPTFAAIFIIAIALGMLSHAPGGAGVIEATMLVALPSVGADRLIAALLLWRLVYYLLPFALALGLLASVEFVRRRGLLARLGVGIAAILRPVAPVVLGAGVFASGGALLVLNALPAGDARLALLQTFLPLPVMEVADALSSMVGVVLLLVSRGLFRRLAAAYRAARTLLPIGVVTALLGGLVWEVAIGLLIVFVLLYVNRRAFYRREPLWLEPVPAPWSAAVLTVLAGSIWIGFFAYAHVDQPGSLWSEFAWNGDAPRFLRATLAAAFTALLLGLLRLRSREAAPPMRTTLTQAEIARLVALDGRAEANRAFVAGGRFLLAEFGDACILYRPSGRSSVAIGDPIGVPARDPELVWAFRELAERHDGWPVFSEASAPRLPLYLELGLSPLKISEAARIDLAAFSPELAAELGETPARARIETSIVPAAAVPALLPRLEAVHGAWAAAERADRSRVVPDFDAAYVTRFDTVIAGHEDRIVAFGSLLAGTEDMALHPVYIRPDAKRSALRALLLRSIARAQERDCRWFDLGTAPLPAEPADSPWPSLSPASVRAFRYGEYFTQAEVLRRFKERFRPAWQARYLVCPGGIVLPQILREAALLAEGRRDRPRRKLRLPRFGLKSRE